MNQEKSLVVTLENYMELAGRTEKIPTENLVISGPVAVAIGTVAIECISEAENMDILKKHLNYGKPLVIGELLALYYSKDDRMKIMEKEEGITLTPQQARLLHAAMGCVTEAGEMLKSICDHIFDNQPLDVVNVKEEGGDGLWYWAIPCRVLGFTFQDMMDANIRKLAARYGDKFTSEAALNRDLTKERSVLEDTVAVDRKAFQEVEVSGQDAESIGEELQEFCDNLLADPCQTTPQHNAAVLQGLLHRLAECQKTTGETLK